MVTFFIPHQNVFPSERILRWDVNKYTIHELVYCKLYPNLYKTGHCFSVGGIYLAWYLFTLINWTNIYSQSPVDANNSSILNVLYYPHVQKSGKYTTLKYVKFGFRPGKRDGFIRITLHWSGQKYKYQIWLLAI